MKRKVPIKKFSCDPKSKWKRTGQAQLKWIAEEWKVTADKEKEREKDGELEKLVPIEILTQLVHENEAPTLRMSDI